MRMLKSKENSLCVVLVTCYSDSLLKRLKLKKLKFSIIPVYRTTIGKCDTYIIIKLFILINRIIKSILFLVC